MESSTTGSGGGGGSPAPFLVKTYEMVDDSCTDEIVSWSESNNSFIVWNPTEFARLLLRNYFKHNNFSSFIRQLNTYGFRKIHHEQWEFANEYFVKDQKHLLNKIHRKKPIHSHNHSQGSHVDPERLAFEEEIEKLSNEKTTIQSNISNFKQNISTAKLHLEELQQRLDGMEKRQKNLLNLFERELQNPKFVEQIYQKIESLNLSGHNKKRRIPHVAENSFVDNDSNFGITEVGNMNIFREDFCSKLNLLSTTSSNEDGESAHNKMLCEGELQKETLRFASGKEGHSLSCSPSVNPISEHTDNGACFTFDMDSSQVGKLNSSEPKSGESDCDQICCLLSLTLASSPAIDISAQIDCQEIGKSVESRLHTNDHKECDIGAFSNRNLDNVVTNLASLIESPNNNQGIPAAPVKDRVNDVFWSQYLTE